MGKHKDSGADFIRICAKVPLTAGAAAFIEVTTPQTGEEAVRQEFFQGKGPDSYASNGAVRGTPTGYEGGCSEWYHCPGGRGGWFTIVWDMKVSVLKLKESAVLERVKKTLLTQDCPSSHLDALKCGIGGILANIAAIPKSSGPGHMSQDLWCKEAAALAGAAAEADDARGALNQVCCLCQTIEL